LDELTLKYSETFKVSLDNSREAIAKLKDALMNIYATIKNTVTKIIEVLKQFVKDNPWIPQYILKKSKYEKRVLHRSQLYIKRKKLGRE